MYCSLLPVLLNSLAALLLHGAMVRRRCSTSSADVDAATLHRLLALRGMHAGLLSGVLNALVTDPERAVKRSRLQASIENIYQTLWSAVAVYKDLPSADGGVFHWPMVRLQSFLPYLVNHCGGFRALVRIALSRHPCSPISP